MVSTGLIIGHNDLKFYKIETDSHKPMKTYPINS